MTMIGIGPVFDMMREEAARQKAHDDWAYRDEMRKLQEASDEYLADKAERDGRSRAFRDFIAQGGFTR